MRKLAKTLFGALLVVAALASAPRTASAIDWCSLCSDNPGDCWSCCRCQGFGFGYCAATCP